MKNPVSNSILNLLSFLASKGFEIQISDRCSSDSWVWDGVSIARYLGIVDSYALGPFGGELRDSEGQLNWEACVALQDGILTLDEQVVQEYATQMLSCYLGNKFEVPIGKRRDDIPFIHTWDQYWNWKKNNEWDLPTSVSETNKNNEENYRKATVLFNEILEILS